MSIVWVQKWDEEDGRDTTILSLSAAVPRQEDGFGYFWWVSLIRWSDEGYHPLLDGEKYPFTRHGYALACRRMRDLGREYGGASAAAPDMDAPALILAQHDSLIPRNYRLHMAERLEASPAVERSDFPALIGGGTRAGAFAFD